LFLYLERKLQPIVSPTLRFQYAKVGEKADSNDILHEVLCRIIGYLREQREDSCEDVVHLQRLSARVLRHTLIDIKRKHFGSLKAHPFADNAETFDPSLSESSGMEGWRERASVHELVDKLEPADRDVVELALYYNLKNADVARSLNISEGQASRRFSRAKERLGALLIEEKQKAERRKSG
jgi:RNA polymerase sigma factor (sigma-70 family)